MPQTIHLTIPAGIPQSVPMKVNDKLEIEVTADCTWCYSDPSGVFSSMLPNGYYAVTTPPTVYGPYTAVKAGTVNFNAVAGNNTCTATGGVTGDTGHTIVVSS